MANPFSFVFRGSMFGCGVSVFMFWVGGVPLPSLSTLAVIVLSLLASSSALALTWTLASRSKGSHNG